MFVTSKLFSRLVLKTNPKWVPTSMIPSISQYSSSSNKLLQAQAVVPAPAEVADNEKPGHTVTEEEGASRSVENDSTSGGKDDHFSARRSAQRDLENTFAPFRYVYPEFLPDPNLKFRNRIREKLERLDMLSRRSHVDIPEFYVGSILSVTVSDSFAPGKVNTFVGICMDRLETGLRSKFTLRNIVDGMGVEICYDLYNPTILNITCLRLEKRLDDNLRYLRDAPPEYSTFPFDMAPELRTDDAPVPINPLKVKLKPKPWLAKWHLWDLKGVEDLSQTPEHLNRWTQKKIKMFKVCTGFDVKEYDLMKTYRSSIPVEEQTEIYSEFAPQLSRLSQSMKKQKRKRTFAKPQKTA